MKTQDIRKKFLDYFKEREHTVVPSSSLVPSNDPTLLFTNAGMVQFKDVFLGLEKSSFTKAASVQRCVRAGGKHNDLENVGYTARHHTFFEMLGNFSFGDYFKREAIRFAWEFITNILKIPPEKLWITVYENDSEAADIWLNEIKIDPSRFSRCGEKDNFWSMGETGPCGPCTEIFYDHGETIPGGPPGTKEEDGDRYIEIWNLVFMQYDRNERGELSPLPKPSVDTGMGLERIAAVMQGVHSNYDIDLFQVLIQYIAKLAGTTDLQNKSLRVIADHIRACAFLIIDGVIPSNESRGYVLRRICRRAIRHGHRLGFQAPFFYKLVDPLVSEMGEAYPLLKVKAEEVKKILHQEELQFERTLEQGLRILEQAFEHSTQTSENISQSVKTTPHSSKEYVENSPTLSGEIVFRLYDTYGFPVDLTADMARERGFLVDMDGFNEAMAIQKTRAREASQFSMQVSDKIDVAHVTDFTGYETLEEESEVLGLFFNQKEVTNLEKGDEGIVVLDHTPFYAEAGGQVGDQGKLFFKDGEFEVHNTRKSGQAHLHIGVMKEGSLALKSKVTAAVNKKKRKATALNHSATHLLHAALRKVLGNHVQQKGSLVEPERLRFDYSHFEPLTKQQIREIEHLVNDQIRYNTPVVTELMPVDEALESGAMALFGEKYDRDKPLRVLRMGGDFSIELCGGTHVVRTGDIGFFKIISEGGIAASVRRLEAVTGKPALDLMDKLQIQLDKIAFLLKTDPESAEEKLQQLMKKNKQLEKDIQQIKLKLLNNEGNAQNFQPKEIGDEHNDIKVQVLAAEISDADAKMLREMMDRLKNQYKTAVIVLGTVHDQKVTLIAGVTPDVIEKYHIQAGEVVKEAARFVGGQGGGRADLAQAGGNQPEGLKDALESVFSLVHERIKQTNLKAAENGR